MLRAKMLLALTLASGLLLPGCSTTESASSQRTDSEESLVLALGDFGEDEFDPLKGWGLHNDHRVLHSSLVKWDADMKLVGDLAKDYTIDGTTWTFNLDPAFKFSDGQPVTAQDVVFTLELLKKDGVSFDLSNVKNVKAEGDHTVIIELDKPDTLFGPQLSLIGILPEHAYDENYGANPIASGPYRVVENQPGEQILMEANPYYPKELKYKKLTFLLGEEESVLAQAAADPDSIDVLKVSPQNADKEVAGHTLNELPTIDTYTLVMPTIKSGAKGVTKGKDVEAGNDITADPAIRKALTIGLDREELVELTLNGYGEPAYSVADGMPWGVDEFAFEDGQVDKAKSILAEAGWEDTNSDGTVDKQGVEAVIPLMAFSTAPERADLAESVAMQAAAFGITIKPEIEAKDKVFEEGKTKGIVFAFGSLSPRELYDSYSSESINKAHHNMAMYSNPEVDKNIEAARTAPTLEEANKYWQEAQKAGANCTPEGDNSMIWLLKRQHLFLIDDDINIGHQPMHGHGHGLQIMMNVEEWS